MDRELNFHDIKQLLRVSKDAMRKNHYVHMHTKPKEPATTKTVATAKTQDLLDHRRKNQRSKRKLDAHSELQIRSNQAVDSSA